MELNISETKTKSGVPLWTLSSPSYNSVAIEDGPCFIYGV